MNNYQLIPGWSEYSCMQAGIVTLNSVLFAWQLRHRGTMFIASARLNIPDVLFWKSNYK